MRYIPVALLSLAFASCFMYVEYKKKYIPAVLLKAAASIGFVIFGILSSSLATDAKFSKFIIIGLVLGCIADVLLNLRFVFEKNGRKIFLVGILVFLGGHIFYLAALLPLCQTLFLYLAVGAVLTVLVLKWLFSKITATAAFKIFGVLYIGAIMLLNSVATGALITSPSGTSILFVVGAVSFLVSDIVLILNTFGPKQQQKLRVTNLSLYYIGQLLIGLSLQFLN